MGSSRTRWVIGQDELSYDEAKRDEEVADIPGEADRGSAVKYERSKG